MMISIEILYIVYAHQFIEACMKLEYKAPTNSTFTDSSIPIHALMTIRLFAKQIVLLNG